MVQELSDSNMDDSRRIMKRHVQKERRHVVHVSIQAAEISKKILVLKTMLEDEVVQAMNGFEKEAIQILLGTYETRLQNLLVYAIKK